MTEEVLIIICFGHLVALAIGFMWGGVTEMRFWENRPRQKLEQAYKEIDRRAHERLMARLKNEKKKE